MNKSKKTIRGPQNKKEKHININPKVWIITSAVLGILLIAAILFDQLYEWPLITINGDKYYLKDLKYYFYETESDIDYIDQMYGGYYWDMTDGSGMTVRDSAKLQTLNNIIKTEVLYREASANGYTLTEDEEKSINEDIDKILNESGLSEKFIKKNGFTTEYLKEVKTKEKLADRYKKDVIDSLDIDEEAIKADINYDDYRQYDFEYFFISTKTSVTNEDGTTKEVDMSDEEKKAAYEKIADMRELALNVKDWSSLVPEDEKELTYHKYSLTASDTIFSDDFRKTVMAMNNNEVSDIIETKDGYYVGYFVVRMINNNSSEAYDTAVKNAIEKAEKEAFNEEFSNNILPKYNYELNERLIRNLRMGRITLVD